MTKLMSIFIILLYDFSLLAGTAFLIGWHGWSGWWLALAVFCMADPGASFLADEEEEDD